MEPLVVVVGETASGKSALGMELAQRFNGEIICADSRTVYKGMDVGTAKPSPKDQAKIPHHLLDVVLPNQKFSAAEFKKLAMGAIKDITSRGKLPIMVGGTGLYVDSVLFDFQFNPKGQRDPDNPRHLLKADQTRQNKLRSNTLVIGLEVEREELKQRIKDRVESMFDKGLPDEVAGLVKKYGLGCEALSAVGYKELQPYLNSEQNLAETKHLIVQNTLNYAKRQRTWFKRNISIIHPSSLDEAVALVTTFLNK